MSATDVHAAAATRLTTWMIWIGRVVSAVPVFICLSSARWKLTHNAWYVGEWSRIGWAPGALSGIGLVQITCVVLYLIPQTALLGTVLLTGYSRRRDCLVRADWRVLSAARPADDVPAGVVGNLICVKNACGCCSRPSAGPAVQQT